MAFSVQTASKADIHELIKIHMAAFANDNAVRLMFKSEDEYEAKLQGILSSGSSDPRAFTLKAVSDDSNEILAWLGYVCIEYSELGAPPSPSELTAETLLNPTLRSILIADFERVQNEWMADKKYIHIGTAVTHPSHQGKGIGSALIRSMTSRADEDDVPCWIQSSPVAHSVYYHAGFRDVGSFEVDLREWAPGGKEGKTGWGVFEIRYMLRLPQSKS